MYIFISHSSKDASTAQELCNIMETNGSNCFLAPRDIRPGYEYADEIIGGIDRSNVMLLLLSNNAIESPHVLREIERAVSKSIPIIVYKLEEVVLTRSYEYFLMSHQWLDAEHCRYDALLNALNNMENDLHTPVTTTATPNMSKSKKYLLPIFIVIASLLLCGVMIGVIVSTMNKGTEVTPDNNASSKETSSNKSSEADVDETDSPTAVANIELGDSIILGKYNGADISWRVIKISDDATEAILVSKDILTFKAFDGADSGKCSYGELTPDTVGNNSWETSSIRAWLNSNKDSVQYEGAAPTDQSMSDTCNGYDMEAGFLYGFSSEELAVIKDTTVETKCNDLSSDETITTTDKVFLLSLDELEWFEEAGVSILSIPTDQAIDNNESTYYEEYCQGVFKVDSSQWWLRDPVENSATDCYQVSHGAKADETICTSIACADGYGIRPAIKVDLTSGLITPSN